MIKKPHFSCAHASTALETGDIVLPSHWHLGSLAFSGDNVFFELTCVKKGSYIWSEVGDNGSIESTSRLVINKTYLEKSTQDVLEILSHFNKNVGNAQNIQDYEIPLKPKTITKSI